MNLFILITLYVLNNKFLLVFYLQRGSRSKLMAQLAKRKNEDDIENSGRFAQQKIDSIKCANVNKIFG